MDKIDFLVAKADLADAEWIARAQAKMAMETENLQLNQEEAVKGVNFIFDHPDRGFYIMAKNQQQVPVGCLMILKEWSDWRGSDFWWIHSVYVVPEYRKLGIFKKIFDYVECLARNSGVRGLRLYVDKRNVKAQMVYDKLGMSKDHYELFEKMF